MFHTASLRPRDFGCLAMLRGTAGTNLVSYVSSEGAASNGAVNTLTAWARRVTCFPGGILSVICYLWRATPLTGQPLTQLSGGKPSCLVTRGRAHTPSWLLGACPLSCLFPLSFPGLLSFPLWASAASSALQALTTLCLPALPSSPSPVPHQPFRH